MRESFFFLLFILTDLSRRYLRLRWESPRLLQFTASPHIQSRMMPTLFPCFSLPTPFSIRTTPRPLHCRLSPSISRRRYKPVSLADCNGLPDPIDVEPSHVADTDASERVRRSTSLDTSNTPDIPIPPQPTIVDVEFAPGRTMRFETGRMARQAAGAVSVRMGDTIVFCTACADDRVGDTADFLPLRVDYAEKFSATGRTSGSYVKREGRPSEREVLISRLIDRPLRPMFADGYFNEVQVLANVFSYDGVHPADALAICGASAALHISKIPLVAPVAAVRVGWRDGWTVEPGIKDCDSEMVVAGCESGILMIEGWAQFLEEDCVVEGVRMAYDAINKLCRGMDEIRRRTGETDKVAYRRLAPEEMLIRMADLATGIDEALAIVGKKQREENVKEVKDRVFSVMGPTKEDKLIYPEEAKRRETLLRIAWKELVSERMRRRILDDNVRPDGRDTWTVRPITIDQAPLPGTHGSCLFTRGETQTLSVATLGGDEMAQRFETLEGEDAARFYLQYSFPPFSVGEVDRVGPPGRREIGHGKLAERALLAAIPAQEEFPYVMRVESNIMESNGSSSMASVCGGCLALLEAGVPLKCSVAGVAMGLVLDKATGRDPETGEFRAVVLTDILGLEDAFGSCDAKFAGNRNGISALQLDVKLRGISIELFERIAKQARKGRAHILDCMDAVMPHHKPTLPVSVPKVEMTRIPIKSIGDVIGPGGKTIKSIIEKCGGDDAIRISIENDGRISLASMDSKMIKKAMDIISAMTVKLGVGAKLTATVTKILPFGAYVEIAEGKEGWLHISELENKRTNSVSDVCKVGDTLEVKIIEVGRGGQFKVSRKVCLPTNPKSLPADGTKKVVASKGSSRDNDPKSEILHEASSEEVQ